MVTNADRIKVWISYSQDDEAHSERVRALSERLRGDGIDCWIDQYEQAPPEGWRRWMDQQIERADFVLMVCTETYHRRSRREEEPGRGLGATYEASQLLDLLYEAGMRNRRTIPILFEDASKEDIPQPLRQYTRFRLDAGYEDLLRLFTKQPSIVAPPLGEVPHLAPKPPANPRREPSTHSVPFWNVPRRTDFFTGREDVLEELEQRLEAAGSAALTQTIVGLGGIGKTQTAIEYCLRHRARYHAGTFWVDASSADSLQAGYAECARGLRLVDEQAPDDKATVAFENHLKRRSGWLVVLDNADTPDAIRSLLPPNSHGHVLITTRDQAPRLGRGEPIRLDCLPIERATAFLLERTRRSEDFQADAEALATALEGLPLALEQAGAYLAEFSTLPLRDYLEKFESLSLDYLEGHEPIEGDYGKKTGHRTIAATWEISFRALEDSAPAAAEVLNACAFLDPQAIPLKVFSEGATHFGPNLEALAESLKVDSTTVHTEILRPLRLYSFVEWVGEEDGLGNLSVHRLVQTVARWRLGDGWPGVVDGVYKAQDDLFPRDYKSPSTWPEAALLLPHVQASAGYWNETHGADPTDLWIYAGNSAWASGRSTQARELHEQCLEVSRRVLGEEHPDTLSSMNNLAETLRALGDSGGARELHEQCLEVSRRVLGEEHPDTLMSMNNLASTLWALGDSGGARELHEQCLEVRRRVLGEEHPDTLSSMNNLAETLRALGDSGGARELHEQCLEVSRRVLGEEHPDTLMSMNNLAETLRALGDSGGARELHEQCLEVRRRVLGEEHPDTLMSMNNLASTLRALGDSGGARELHEQCLEVSRRVLGEEHPSTLNSMNNLASTLWALGDSGGARELHEQCLEVSRRVLGEEHPSTLSSMNNLAETLRALGDSGGARELHEQCLEVSRRVLGEEHPSTLMSMNNLASTLRALGDSGGARELHEQCLEVRRRVLGEEHPSTLNSMNNLASTLWALGDSGGARELHEQCLEVRRRVLGEEHPDTLMSMNNLAETLRALGDSGGARELHEQCLEVSRRVLGEEHPSTLSSMNNLASTLRALGDSGGARELHKQCLEVRRRVLGEEHPDTLMSMGNLAATLWGQGDLEGAVQLEVAVLKIRQRLLGDKHPDTLLSMHNLAFTLRDLGKVEAARPLFSGAATGSQEVLGEDHPDTKARVASFQEFEESHPQDS